MTSKSYTLVPKGNHTHTFILLHGRDSTASEFANEFFESQASNKLTLPEIFPSFRWVFPGSILRFSARFGCEMSQWFDIWSVEEPEIQKELQIDGLQQSIEAIHGIVHDEAEMLDGRYDRIFLGGISQGCATAMSMVMHTQFDIPRLAGFLGFCGWLPFSSEIEENGFSTSLQLLERVEYPNRNEQTPVFLAHAQDDEVVPVRNGEDLYSCIRGLLPATTLKIYKHGGHWINEPEGVDDIADFLTANQSLN